MEDTRCRVPRTCTASGTLLCGDVRPHLVLVQLNPPLRDQNFSFTGHFVANPATNFAKKRNKKTRHLQSNAGCIVNWHPPKLCCHLKKKDINHPTPQWSAVLLCVLSYKGDIRQNYVIANVFPCHIGGTCPVKELWWSRNGAFLGTKKRRRRTSLLQTHFPPSNDMSRATPAPGVRYSP